LVTTISPCGPRSVLILAEFIDSSHREKLNLKMKLLGGAVTGAEPVSLWGVRANYSAF
jgi:hypothetical protein